MCVITELMNKKHSAPCNVSVHARNSNMKQMKHRCIYELPLVTITRNERGDTATTHTYLAVSQSTVLFALSLPSKQASKLASEGACIQLRR